MPLYEKGKETREEEAENECKRLIDEPVMQNRPEGVGFRV